MEEKEKKPKSKLRKILEWVGTGIVGAVFALAAIANFAKLLTRNQYGEGTAFGYSTYLVLTPSMDPVYPVDSTIITYKYDCEEIVNKWNEIKDLNLDPTDERNINLTFIDGYDTHTPCPVEGFTNQTTSRSNGVWEQVMTHQLFYVSVDTSKQEGEGRYKFFVHGINPDPAYYSASNQYQVFTETQLLGVVKSNSVFLGSISKFISSVWGLLILLLIPCLYLVISSILDIFKAANMEDDEELATEGANGAAPNAISDKDYESLKQQMIDEMLNSKKGDKK